MISSEPRLFQTIVRFRIGLIIQVMVTELANAQGSNGKLKCLVSFCVLSLNMITTTVIESNRCTDVDFLT